MSLKCKSRALGSDILGIDASKTLMVRIGDRSLAFDVITMAKSPRGEKKETLAWSRKVSCLGDISYSSKFRCGMIQILTLVLFAHLWLVESH